ncbi:ragulator complex protein LAMTOR5 homolog [Branchiostoma lanceolatum]|uniref:ragulator complex protein LAMTOR5 homolog n=1 Tax=Branchiostoma lanceolatum TaxID=7740 RepID=UPI0034538E95
MEKELDKHLEETMTTHGVLGTMCANQHGMCLGAKGSVSGDSAGMVTRLSELAGQLDPSSEEDPIVCIESDASTLMIKKHDDVTMAIHKAKVPT